MLIPKILEQYSSHNFYGDVGVIVLTLLLTKLFQRLDPKLSSCCLQLFMDTSFRHKSSLPDVLIFPSAQAVLESCMLVRILRHFKRVRLAM